MNIWDQQAIQIFLLLFVPGFVFIKVYDLFVPSERRDFTKTLPETIGLSAFNFSICYPIFLLTPINKSADTWLFIMLLWVTLFMIPACLAILWVWISNRKLFKKFIRNLTPTAWDHVFESNENYWVIIHLSDGRRIGGKYYTQSFATAHPEEPQIYLEEVWKLDEHGAFIARVDRSKGVVVFGKDMTSIEFFEFGGTSP